MFVPFLIVPKMGLEPIRPKRPRNFKSLVSTIPPLGHCKATLALRPGRESNPR